MNDVDFVLWCLEHSPHTTMGLIRRSESLRGCGLTPHSRVADLRRRGHDVRCRRIGTYNRRPIFEYALVREPVQLELTG
jgi:hypothetical protein